MKKFFLGGNSGFFEKNGGQKGVKTGFFQILFFSIGIWFSCMGNTIKSVLSRFGPILTEFLPKNGVWKAGVQNLGVPPNSKGRKKFFFSIYILQNLIDCAPDIHESNAF